MIDGLLHTSRYAIPALGLCTKQPQQKISELQQRISNGGALTEQEMEELFPNAYGKLHIISKQMGLSMWNITVSKKYWYEVHNKENDPICQVGAAIYHEYSTLKPAPQYLGILKPNEIIITHLNAPIERLL
jgi:hypothetical protein